MEIVDLAVEDVGSAAVLDISVQNRGTARVVSRRASIRVERFTQIRVCNTQGELEVTGEYDLSLPSPADVGYTASKKLNQQVGADEADRFQVRLQNKDQKKPHTVSFYGLDVTIETNGSPPSIHAGKAMVALPLVPSNTDAGWYWSSRFVREPLDWLGPQQAAVEACMHGNSRAMQEFLTGPGVLSEALLNLRSDLL
ncbi:hypothetical protein Afe04nite_38730 [Asanoa ferruginea]|nr:hypothetical protein Afe04nite_38730 [Asanoa ferruginea]